MAWEISQFEVGGRDKAACLDDCHSFSFEDIRLVAKIWQFIVPCAHFHTMFFPGQKQKQEKRHLTGVATTLAWAMLRILENRPNIPFWTHSPTFLWLSMIGEKTIQAGRLRQPYHIAHQNLRSQNLPLTFFFFSHASRMSFNWVEQLHQNWRMHNKPVTICVSREMRI